MAQDYLVSSNGLYFAQIQGPGNFTLYHTTGSPNHSPDLDCPYWATNTSQQESQYSAIMQGDGNFVLYAKYEGNQKALWATNTAHSSQGQYIAVLHDTGNFAIYSGSDPNQVSQNTRLWQSNTAMDPTSYFLKILSGNNQNLQGITNIGTYTPLPELVVQVNQQNGQPAPHVPVTFGLVESWPANGFGFAMRFTSKGANWFTQSTDANGIARLNQAGVNCYTEGGCGFTINAQVANGGSVSFTESIGIS